MVDHGVIPELPNDWRGLCFNTKGDGAADFEVEHWNNLKPLRPAEGGDCGPNTARADVIGIGGKGVFQLLL